jgi:hypothetical protein
MIRWLWRSRSAAHGRHLSHWQFHCDMATALRLAWWILWHWWAKAHWFGLRRWVYYRALTHQLNQVRGQRPQ